MQISTNQNAVKSHPWMKCPRVETQYPGLAYIFSLQELIVAEYKDVLHDIISKKGYTYTIFNNEGQKIFLALLEKKFKKFHVKIFNNYGNEVIHVKRPFTLCTNKVLVWAPPGNYVGSVNEVRRCCNTFIVKNDLGKDVLKIVAEGLYDCVYKVMLCSGATIGVVKKQWSAGLNVKNFGISFPAEMDVKDKAVLLGACFLIGYLKYN